MIFTKTPLRISLGGGGTDLPSYYERFGGSVISAAINKFIYVGISQASPGTYIIRVDTELRFYNNSRDIEHPIIRAVVRFWNLKSVHISVSSDLPGGTGLGSSGALTVGLVNAVMRYKYSVAMGMKELAEQAYQIERDMVKAPVGKQDQYIAAYGGIQHIEIDKDGKTTVVPVMTKPEADDLGLDKSLALFYTGITRHAKNLLQKQEQNSAVEGPALDALHTIKKLSQNVLIALRMEVIQELGLLMDDHWQAKKNISKDITTDLINSSYELGKKSGAFGGKLVGAGGGGFLLFVYSGSIIDGIRLRRTMALAGMKHVPIAIEWTGSREVE